MAKDQVYSHTIMVVDDCEDIRAMLTVMLNILGYRVVEARDGQEAVEIARCECPDLILMDLSMPVLDGYGATRLIREAADICDVPIVACSAHDTIDHRIKALNVGCNAYITKPVELAKLNTVVCDFLSLAA